MLNVCPVVSSQYLVSVPLRMFRLWAFMGMMAQVRAAHGRASSADVYLTCANIRSVVWDLSMDSWLLTTFEFASKPVWYVFATFIWPVCRTSKQNHAVACC